LLAYDTFVEPLTLDEREQYFGEFRQAGSIWGIPAEDFPSSLVDLRAWMAWLIESGEVCVTAQGRDVGQYILNPPVWWIPGPLALVMRWSTIWLLPPALREGFGYGWGPRRERLVRGLATGSRAIVPRLPHILRDLPIARAADHRIRR